MKLCAIICEYNPMHNGHVYQIHQAKLLSQADGIVCVMGGNFNQRGLPCVFDKNKKAKIAINNGADMVCEMPSAYCVQSAEIFALCAIKMLNSMPDVTHICFGSECGDINLLNDIAFFLLAPPKVFKMRLKKHLKSGLSYAASIENSIDNKVWKEIIKKPNNLLAIEYLKALKRTKSKIIPITIKREDNYNETAINGEFISATAIRNAVLQQKIQEIKEFIPEDTFINLQNANVDDSKFYLLANYCFNIKNKGITDINEVNEGIENYLKNTFNPTSRYKINRINRTLINVLLNIDKSVIKQLYKVKKLPYIKVLACKKSLLPIACKTSLILRKQDINKKNKFFRKLEVIDNNSNILYNLMYESNLTKNSLYDKAIFID